MVNFKMTGARPSVWTSSAFLGVLKQSWGVTALRYQWSLSYSNRIDNVPWAPCLMGTSHWQTSSVAYSEQTISTRMRWRNQTHHLHEEIKFTTYLLDCAQLWNSLWGCKSFSSESSWNFSWQRWQRQISTGNSSTKTCCASTVKGYLSDIGRKHVQTAWDH